MWSVHRSDRNESFPTSFMGIFTFKPFFSKSVHHLLSQILAFGLLPSKLNQYQQFIFAMHMKWHLDVFTHCLMQLGRTQNANLQLQMHKLCFDI